MLPILFVAAPEGFALIQSNIDWLAVIQFTIATVLPLAVAVVTTKVTSSKIKGLLLAAFALILTVLTAIADALVTGVPVDLVGVLAGALQTFAWSVVSYFGIWRAEGKNGAPSVSDYVTENVGRTSHDGLG